MRADTRRQMLAVDVPQPGPDLLLARMGRVEGAEEGPQFIVRVLRQVHLPDTLVVAQEGEDREGLADTGLEGRAGKSEAAALRAANGRDPRFVHLVEAHHDAGHLGTVEVDVPEQQVLGGIIEAADDVAAERVALDAANVLGLPGLPAAVEGGDAVAGRHIAELIMPVTGAAAVAVELHDGGQRAGSTGRADVLGMDARSADTGEVEVKALGAGDAEARGPELDLRVDGAHLGKRGVPVLIEVRRSRIAALVGHECIEGHVNEWHLVLSHVAVRSDRQSGPVRRVAGNTCVARAHTGASAHVAGVPYISVIISSHQTRIRRGPSV